MDITVGIGRLGLGLHEGVAASGLVEAHNDEAGHDKDPVDVVGDDRAVGGRVGPSKDGVEDTPSLAARSFRTTALERISQLQFYNFGENLY